MTPQPRTPPPAAIHASRSASGVTLGTTTGIDARPCSCRNLLGSGGSDVPRQQVECRTIARGPCRELDQLTTARAPSDGLYSAAVSDSPSQSHREHKASSPATVRCAVLTVSDTRTEANDTGGRAIVTLL